MPIIIISICMKLFHFRFIMGNNLAKITRATGEDIKLDKEQREAIIAMRMDLMELVQSIHKKIERSVKESTGEIAGFINNSNENMENEIKMAIIKMHSFENRRDQLVIKQAEALEQWSDALERMKQLGERQKRDTIEDYNVADLLEGMSTNNTLNTPFNPELFMKYEPCKYENTSKLSSYETTIGSSSLLVIMALLIAILVKINKLVTNSKGKN